MGTFGQSEQLIGIGIRKDNIDGIVDQFEWCDFELKGLTELCGSGSRTSLIQKKYRHLCYLFESAYALAIEQRRNISGNPGFEWQLKFYGK